MDNIMYNSKTLPCDGKLGIQTHSGNKFYFEPEDFSKNVVLISDIIHSLSQTNRFNGHSRTPYSVLHHQLLVAEALEKLYPDSTSLHWEGLNHDAVEAYIGDMASPLKRKIPAFKEYETQLEEFLMPKLGVNFPFDPRVKLIDRSLLLLENEKFMPKNFEANDKERDGCIDLSGVVKIRLMPAFVVRFLYRRKWNKLRAKMIAEGLISSSNLVHA